MHDRLGVAAPRTRRPMQNTLFTEAGGPGLALWWTTFDWSVETYHPPTDTAGLIVLVCPNLL